MYCIIVFVFFFFFHFCVEISFTGLSTRPLPYSPSSTNGLYIRDRCGRFMVCEFSDNLKNRFFPLIFLKPCWPIYTFKISFFCEHLFNLLLGYIVKHHILGGNRGFHFPLWNLGFYSTKKKAFSFQSGFSKFDLILYPKSWFLILTLFHLQFSFISTSFLVGSVSSCEIQLELDFSHFEDHPFD